ncbi:MAG: 4,5-dihydroxyphthalate decarboxylase [Burkholderiales bacterium RIFCSPLOWO2_12_67_14]|jgi:4,5-dihydroxyphthalate decarboxylase|uniref:ABC transporter substrate-binding protein n=1 Tax=Hydrogenophaga sp. TaxID=1904254 RepID=UPI0008BBCF89|nr:ABC transporter substrate-binding protein [Hydrogenophaga sp.]OGB18145.1 MAG: 4,5-dihydroxyphthalate decarboxylase [Burkholderiales bacterium RIFCSPLOWO2_02_FULL_67_64]OGB43996.1 MAG: 4,5-dihydroxyphthalate decarboxylase [Burkholderiales bacterium RIFCSPHIGHO2_12_FULL_67_38]OGB44219.1 MAG: 4,5-dihydroxyphthalate decarboxylase [Burkholderiales bacterium RIFCSPLOWO2_12_67_14]OGC02432.1 MAG: 4,5-dihydroxyphthalate decarboxylase [Burkholderiales bacterium RIFCSPLOWO2_12_FULL_67_210]MBL8390008.1
MTKLRLSVAMGDYDRNRALYDGRVQIDGCDPVYMLLNPEEMFFRAMRSRDFDITELSFSSYLVKHAKGESPYIGVPVFLSRAFRHTSIYVRKDRIRKPEDLKGCRIGVPEYQLTAIVWARSILQDDYGIRPEDVTWVRGGIDTPGRPEKIKLELPAGVKVEAAPEMRTISDMLNTGEIDAFIAPRPPSGAALTNPDVAWLFDDPTAVAKDYYKRTGIFPIMHVVGIRKELAEQNRWLPGAVFKAFSESKAKALELLADTSATKVTLPFVEEQLKAARETLGQDFWSYGVGPNRKTLEAFLHHHHAQGLSCRRVGLDELFDPSTYESYSI